MLKAWLVLQLTLGPGLMEVGWKRLSVVCSTVCPLRNEGDRVTLSGPADRSSWMLYKGKLGLSKG